MYNLPLNPPGSFSCIALCEVGRVLEVLETDEVLFNTPRADEAIENADTSCLIVRATGARATERLLANNSTSAFLIIVHVSSSVAKLVVGFN